MTLKTFNKLALTMITIAVIITLLAPWLCKHETITGCIITYLIGEAIFNSKQFKQWLMR